MTGSLGEKFNPAVPSSARVYNVWLGGKDNFLSDREFAAKVQEVYPEVIQDAQQNRAFMREVVTWLVRKMGVRQFIDVGAGLPTEQNVHQLAQAIAPESRVVYVDHDPQVMVRARALLVSSDAGFCTYVEADAQNPDRILTEASQVLDFAQPVALTMISVLHYVTDEDDPYQIVARLMAALPPGSYLAISHGTHDLLCEERRERLAKLWQASPTKSQVRSRAEIERFFAGLDLVAPGVVPLPGWSGQDGARQDEETAFYVGVARKS